MERFSLRDSCNGMGRIMRTGEGGNGSFALSHTHAHFFISVVVWRVMEILINPHRPFSS